MSELENIRSLEKYDVWKKAKQSKKTWMSVIALFSAVLIAYIAGNMLMKVRFGETKKIFTYGFTDEKNLETANQSKLPTDYTEWYKKIKENPWTKKFGKKEEYFKKGEIAKRKAEKDKKDGGGGITGDIVAWWLSKGLTKEETEKVDYYQYANHIYWNVAMFLIASWTIFYIVLYLVLRYLVLPLIWKEPLLSSQEIDL